MSTTTFTHTSLTYEAALMSLFRAPPPPPEATESDLSKLFTPDFTQRDPHRDALAERPDSTSVLADGRVAHGETFQFVEVAEDGRIRKIVETVRSRYQK
ncbi:hypothetical protein BO71DRAFT_489406 [Aspergillus ellipticus CBS 707.79]|uniref:Uncharacterized protein n=1 Tax=Aspergillus ellipticus CBS 707.79 TaxID=1448320 RepID=A0A319CQK2_9EURO|nr:hypothetical protein BO71DRAFT_489406 [Aspergillus ellipticus CBS 707.79]